MPLYLELRAPFDRVAEPAVVAGFDTRGVSGSKARRRGKGKNEPAFSCLVATVSINDGRVFCKLLGRKLATVGESII